MSSDLQMMGFRFQRISSVRHASHAIPIQQSMAVALLEAREMISTAPATQACMATGQFAHHARPATQTH
jgi:hypothetical protein